MTKLLKNTQQMFGKTIGQSAFKNHKNMKMLGIFTSHPNQDNFKKLKIIKHCFDNLTFSI